MAQATTPAPVRTVVLPGTHWIGQFYVYCPVVDTESYYVLTHEAPECAGCGVTVTDELMNEENILPLATRLATVAKAQFKKKAFKASRPSAAYALLSID